MSLSAELTLQDYWRIVHRRKALLITAWILVIVTTYFFTKFQTPEYEAQSTLKIELSPSLMATAQSLNEVRALINTEVKTMRGLPVVIETCRRLGYLAAGDLEEHSVRVGSALQDKIATDRIPDSNLIRITVEADGAQKAADIANTLAQVYIEKATADRGRKARDMRDFTLSEMAKAEVKLREAEDNLKKYSEKEGARGASGYLSNQLMSLETRLDDLMKSYTAQHPEVLETKSKIAAIRAQLRQLPQEEVESQRLAREVRMNEDLYTFLAKKSKEAQISEAERDQFAFLDTPAIVPEKPVRPNMQLNMGVGAIIGLFLGLVAVLIRENLDTSIGTIEDVERILELPVLAVIPHIETAFKGKSLFSLGEGANSSLEAIRSRLVIFHPTHSSFGEAYHTLRTNLRIPMSPGKRPGAFLAFTSASVSDGKTLTASNFCLIAAQTGLKTLLIEADLRRPSAHRLLGLSREPGLSDCVLRGLPLEKAAMGTSDFLMGDLDVEKVLKTPGIENFRLLPCGPSPINPADILGSERFYALLRQARTQFDLIVADCAPVMLFADALLVSPQTDGVVLVYKAGRTTRGALKRAKDQLVNIQAKVLGVVLNDLRASEMEPYYGYYYYSYKYEPTPLPKGRKG